MNVIAREKNAELFNPSPLLIKDNVIAKLSLIFLEGQK